MLKSLAVAAFLLMATPALGADCFRYGETVTLEGTFGAALRANAEDGAPTGKARRADLILLDPAICVASDVLSEGVPSAASLQLLCPDLVLKDGDQVSVTGRLVGSHTGNGQTPVLLVCSFGLKPVAGS